MPESQLELPPEKGWGWKDWVIVALWSVTMALAGLGYTSIKESVTKIYDSQNQQAQAFGDFKLENERRWSTAWRVMDKICNYQTERMQKEGKSPDYHLDGQGR